MKGDFSRITHDPAKHYAGVLHQQGRVWLDADWNEDVYDRLDLVREETRDLVGACGTPEPGTAFAIRPNPNPGSSPDDFLIGGGPGPAGHYYVDGILCRLDEPTSYRQQPDLPDAPPVVMPSAGQAQAAMVYLEAWDRYISYLEDSDLREIALGGPDTAGRIKTVAQVKVMPIPGDANTITCADVQLPGPGEGTLSTLQPTLSPPDDPCRLPDPSNYTGRENHLYRVEIHDGGDVRGAAAGSAFQAQLAANVALGATSVTLVNPPTATQIAAMTRSGVVRLIDDTGQSEVVPVADPPLDSSGTQLALARPLANAYGVVNNAAIVAGVARFKWSRDNAAFAVHVVAVSSDRRTLTLSALGRDQATALRGLDLVEITNDASDLGPACGHLAYLTTHPEPDPDHFTVTIDQPLPPNFAVDLLQRHLVLRRWDGVGWASASFDDVGTPDMNLGQGVHIQFGGFDLRPGDYWQFTARSIDGSVEPLTNAPPAGIKRHVCPLAIVRWAYGAPYNPYTVVHAFRDAGILNTEQLQALEHLAVEAAESGTGSLQQDQVTELAQKVGANTDQIAEIEKALDASLSFLVMRDCRRLFPPLTEPNLFYVGGDGQEAMPGQVLPQPLEVGVANGQILVPNTPVQFSVTVGGGTLRAGSTSGQSISVQTDANGIARCTWQLDGTPRSQQVEARLADGRGLPVHFDASPSVASEVAYDPSNCPDLKDAQTVQAAIDRLCSSGRTTEPAFHVVQLRLGDEALLNDSEVPVEKLAEQFIRVVCDGQPDPFAVTRKPVCFLTLDIPFPLPHVDTQIWGPTPIGTRPLTLSADVLPEGESIIWRPTDQTRHWLVTFLPSALGGVPQPRRILTHFIVKGNFIWDAENPDAYLDGEVFGIRAVDGGPTTDIQLPRSGNDVRGGDLDMWFWLVFGDVKG